MNLEPHKPHTRVFVGVVERPWGGWDKVIGEDMGRAYVDVFEPMECVYVNGDYWRVVVQEVLVHPEDKLVVPSRVDTAEGINPGGKLPVRVDPCDCISSHGSTHRCEVLCRYDIEFQELVTCQNVWHVMVELQLGGEGIGMKELVVELYERFCVALMRMKEKERKSR